MLIVCVRRESWTTQEPISSHAFLTRGEVEGPGGDDGYRKGGDERGVDAEGQVKCRDLGFGLKVDQ